MGLFRNKVRVDIREYYLDDQGEKRPGKKGISLSLEEYKKLKDCMDDIDKTIKKIDEVPTDDSDESVSILRFDAYIIVIMPLFFFI